VDERATVVVASASEGVHAQLRLTLGDERFDLLEANDVRAAATEIGQHRPDLLVLDIELDGGAGNLVDSLRAQPETEDLRVLLLAPRDRDPASLPEEVDATIGLPATSFALLRRIEDLLSGT
jgi:DNA-binding response OmpR family regulator